jgi:hypothetical protein
MGLRYGPVQARAGKCPPHRQIGHEFIKNAENSGESIYGTRVMPGLMRRMQNATKGA